MFYFFFPDQILLKHHLYHTKMLVLNIEQLQNIGIHINPYRSLPYDLRGRLAKSTEEHTMICSAILSGEGEKASELMRDHILLQGKRLPAVLKLIAH